MASTQTRSVRCTFTLGSSRCGEDAAIRCLLLSRLGARSRPCARVLACALVAGGALLGAFRAEPLLLQSLHDAGAAQPHWVGLAAAGFLTAALASAAAWWSALTSCRGTIRFFDAASRYAVGCLVNTFVPGRAGDAVRVGLLSRAFEERNRLLTTAGVFVFLGVARAVALTLVLTGAVATGLMPVGTLAIPATLVALAAGLVLVSRWWQGGRLASGFVEAVVLVRSAAPVGAFAWLLVSSLARVGAAAASTAALGVPNPLAAAAIIVPALELANLVPLTPGNLGITSAVIALALRAQGIGTSSAVAVGIVFHAVETIVGVSVGLTGTLTLVGSRFPLVPRLAVAGAVLATAVAVGGVFGMLPDVA
jgi:uncharacterized membrane protein YbhN (UPF0104 family)